VRGVKGGTWGVSGGRKQNRKAGVEGRGDNGGLRVKGKA